MNHLDGKLYVGSERRDTFRDAVESRFVLDPGSLVVSLCECSVLSSCTGTSVCSVSTAVLAVAVVSCKSINSLYIQRGA